MSDYNDLTGQHHFCPVTNFCTKCGCSRQAAVVAGVGCYTDQTNLVAFMPYLARKRKEDEFVNPVLELINEGD